MHRKTIGLRSGALLGTMVACGVVLTGSAFGKDSLEARVRELEDRIAIKQLLMGDYPKALDSANWKDYGALFTDEGVLVIGKTMTKGPAAIEKLFSTPRAPRQRPAAADGSAPAAPRTRAITKHIVTDVNLTINGDTAIDTAYWQTVALRDGKTTIAGAGHYRDVLKKVNGVWKFDFREIMN